MSPTAIVMSPRTSELDDDFILGIAFCIIWKAPRIQTRGMNLGNFAKMQHLAKLNVSAPQPSPSFTLSAAGE